MKLQESTDLTTRKLLKPILLIGATVECRDFENFSKYSAQILGILSNSKKLLQEIILSVSTSILVLDM